MRSASALFTGLFGVKPGILCIPSSIPDENIRANLLISSAVSNCGMASRAAISSFSSTSPGFSSPVKFGNSNILIAATSYVSILYLLFGIHAFTCSFSNSKTSLRINIHVLMSRVFLLNCDLLSISRIFSAIQHFQLCYISCLLAFQETVFIIIIFTNNIFNTINLPCLI